MKKLFVFTMLATLNIFAAGSEYFMAVLNNSHLKELSAIGYAKQIKSIEHDMTNTYRCFGCFDFNVTIISAADKEEVLTYQTEDFMGKIKVRSR